MYNNIEKKKNSLELQKKQTFLVTQIQQNKQKKTWIISVNHSAKISFILRPTPYKSINFFYKM